MDKSGALVFAAEAVTVNQQDGLPKSAAVRTQSRPRLPVEGREAKEVASSSLPLDPMSGEGL